jgi:hypothetical protein
MMCFGAWAQHGFSPEEFLVVREKQKEAFHLALRATALRSFSRTRLERKHYNGCSTPALAFAATIPITFEGTVFPNQDFLKGRT